MIEQATAEIEQAQFDYAGWFSHVETLRQQIRASQGNKLPPLDVVGMLRDIRDGEDE